MNNDGKAFNLHRLSRQELAALLGRTLRTITNWSQRGCPRNADGTYNLADVQQWLILRRQRRADPEPSNETIRSARDQCDLYRARYARAKARLLELEMEVKLGRLVDIESVGDKWARIGTQLKQNLETLPASLAAEIAATTSPEEAEGILRTALADVLAGLDRPN